MAGDTSTRKLAAILHADVVGFSRLMGEDEAGTHRTLRQYLDEITSVINGHQGRVVNYAGDAVLADFDTVSEALAAAVGIQDYLEHQHKSSDHTDEPKLQFRIGVNLGEVIIDGDDIYGDGVNVAARLETLADPGGICVSESVRSAAVSSQSLDFEFLGERKVKNIAKPVRAYRVVKAGELAQGPPTCPYPGMVPFSAATAKHFLRAQR